MSHLEGPDDLVYSGQGFFDLYHVDRDRPEPDGEIYAGLHLHASLRRRRTVDPIAADFCAVLEFGEDLTRDHVGLIARWRLDPDVARARKAWLDDSVLVGIREVAQEVERVCLHPARVGLIRVDDCPLREFSDTSEQTVPVTSLLALTDVLIGVEGDGESRSVWLRSGEAIDQMIPTRRWRW